MTTNGAVPNSFGGYITWTLWTPTGITQTNGGFYLKFTSTPANVGNI